MSISASSNSRLSRMGFMLAFLALWLRLMVPTGFMPVASTNGPVFGICSTSSSPVLGKSGAPEDPSPKAGADCVFSLLHAFALSVADLTALGMPLGKMEAPAPSSPAVSPPRDRLFAPPPPSHAPPDLSI